MNVKRTQALKLAFTIHAFRRSSPQRSMDSQPLDFEKPILELQRRLQELKSHSEKHDIDFDSEVESMELKIRETRRQIYENLTAWQRVQIARHVQRPFTLDYIGAVSLNGRNCTATAFSAMTRRCRAVWPNSAPNTASSSPSKKAGTQKKT